MYLDMSQISHDGASLAKRAIPECTLGYTVRCKRMKQNREEGNALCAHNSTNVSHSENSVPIHSLGAEVYTSLPLQMAVYFNAVYAPLWIIGFVLALQTKVFEILFPIHPSRYRSKGNTQV